MSTLFFQPVVVRHFTGGWYVGWGDLPWQYEWHSGNHQYPINGRLGKVLAIGKQKFNIFVEPFVQGWHHGASQQWGVKLNVTLLLPGLNF